MRRCFVGIGLAAILVAGCGGSSSTFESGGAAGELDFATNSPVLQGRVKLGDVPVVGTEVELSQAGRVLGTATSDDLGYFQFDLAQLDPTLGNPNSVAGQTASAVREVSATVDGARYCALVPQGAGFVWVTEISTLIHDYVEDHPEATIESADAAVGAALGCPPGESVRTLSDGGIFDPATFQEMAAANGGDAAFLASVEAGLDSGESFDFSRANPDEALEHLGQNPHQPVIRRAGLQADPITAIGLFAAGGKGIALGVLGEVGARLFGWLVAAAGTNDEPSLTDVVRQLTAIQSSLSALQASLSGQLAEGRWENAFVGLGATTTQLNRYLDQQQRIFDQRNNPAGLLDQTNRYLADSNFSAVAADTYATQLLANILVQNPGQDVVLAFHRLFMQQEYNRENPTAQLGFYDLRTDKNTEVLQENLNYCLALVEVSTDMLTNAAHSNFLRPQTLRPFDQDPPANTLPGDINNARAILHRGGEGLDVGNRIKRALQTVPPKLGNEDIMVLPPDFPAAVEGTPTLLLLDTWTRTYQDPWDPRFHAGFRTEFLQATAGKPWDDVESWMVPTLGQYQALDRIASLAGGGDARAGLVKLGLWPSNEPLSWFVIRDAHYRESQDRDIFGRRGARGSSMDLFRFSSPGRAAGVERLQLFSVLPRDVRVAGLFVRGSISGNTEDQFETILATGSAGVRPTLQVQRVGTRGVHRMAAIASYAFPTGQRVSIDVTDRVAWHSDNPNALEVSNFEDEDLPAGALTFSRGTANITAALLVDAGRPARAESYVTASSSQNWIGDPPRIERIMITPQEVTFDRARDVAGYFYCTSSEVAVIPPGRPPHRCSDLTNDEFLDWSLLGPDGEPVDANRATVTSALGGQDRHGGILRIFDVTLPDGEYTVRARYRRFNGFIDHTGDAKIYFRLRP